MTASRQESAFILETMTDRLEIRPVGTLAEALALLPEADDRWGFWTTPAEAHLGRQNAEQWRSVLAMPRLTEARIFGEDMDLHWRGDRGVCLRLRTAEAASEELVSGPGWLQRQRRARLWGEWLAEAGGWYEERIPDALRFAGLAWGPENVLAFLVYREYVFRGAVQYVRYLGVEGGSR